MLRRSILIVLSAGLVAAAPGTAADHTRVKSDCSVSGDVCFGIFKDGAGLYRFRLTLAARYFGRYRLCVRPLGETALCKSFPVRKTGANWGGTVVWQRNYPVRGPRGYRATWRQGTRRLGPSLTFYLPAPAA